MSRTEAIEIIKQHTTTDAERMIAYNAFMLGEHFAASAEYPKFIESADGGTKARIDQHKFRWIG